MEELYILGVWFNQKPIYSDDDNLRNTFDITIGLDESFDQPMDNDVLQHLENFFIWLGERWQLYSLRNILWWDVLMEELYILGVWFNQVNEIY